MLNRSKLRLCVSLSWCNLRQVSKYLNSRLRQITHNGKNIDYLRWITHYDKNINFQVDNWSSLSPLRQYFHGPFQQDQYSWKVQDLIIFIGVWNLPILKQFFTTKILHRIHTLILKIRILMIWLGIVLGMENFHPPMHML